MISYNWKDKVRYATWWWFIWYYDENWNPVWDQNWSIYYWNADVYDLIPQVWDIAVWVWWPYNKQYWHTMFIDSVWKNEQWEWMFHYTATNKSSKPWEYTVWYEWTKSLSEFMSNWWIWFWNPYKQAQYNWQSQEQVNEYSPMQPTIDRLMEEYRNSWKTNLFSELWKFQEIYTNLWKADKNWELSAVLDQWSVWTFLDNVALAWALDQGWDSQIVNWSAIERFMWLTVWQALAAADEYVAQHQYDEKAYAWFLTMMRAVEIKLRDESWAAINQSERATNFLLNLPKAADTDYVKSSKLERLWEYVRRLGTDAWITSKEYIPLVLWIKSRSYE